MHSQSSRSPALLVASGGGHLEELIRLSDRVVPSDTPRIWMTPDTVHARSLLDGELVHFTGYVGPREFRSLSPLFRQTNRLIQRFQIASVFSTGAAIAIPAFLAARKSGLECHYIESAARAIGPSMSGKIVERIPGVRLYTQYSIWANKNWLYSGSVFDGFDVTQLTAKTQCNKVVVTFGTMQKYGFRRAIEVIAPILQGIGVESSNILWQTGCTRLDGLSIDGRAMVPAQELREAMAEADLIIAHAGVGSALTALELGKAPIIIPRESRFNEHVDDHQTMIANELNTRGLAVACKVEDFDNSSISRALNLRISHSSSFKPFKLIRKDGYHD